MFHRARRSGSGVTLYCQNSRQRFIIISLIAAAALLSARAAWIIPSAQAAEIENSFEVVTVSAASFIGAPAALAPNSIVSAFGTQLATQTLVATDAEPGTPGIQLPTSLAGTTVEIVDGASRVPAGLIFVSAFQINFVIPPSISSGIKQIIVTSTLANNVDKVISRGTINMAAVAPGLFAANSDGSGAPAANTGRLDASGTVFVYDPSLPVEPDPLQPGRFLPAPIDVGTDARPAFILLYGTGVRNAPLSAVRAIIGGVDAPVSYAGLQGDFAGLDQINVQIPTALRGRGRVDLTVVVNGISSNTLSVNLAGNAGAGLSVSSFSDNALAGQTVTINGSGFSTNASENIVRFGSAEGRVVSATNTQLRVILPFGAESGRLTVQNTNGEVRSSTTFRVLTSVSGIIQSTGTPSTPPAPLEGVTVRVAGDTLSVRTNRQGSFVLSGVRPGATLIEVDGATTNVSPPYPRVTLKMAIGVDRDNQFTQPISLQQPTGAGTNVGGGGLGQADNGSSFAKAFLASSSSRVPLGKRRTLAANAAIEDRGVTLDVPLGTSVRFADGKTSGQVRLTVLEKSRLPGINLPVGVYSSTIAQITPFGATFSPGAILSFPNPDPANLNAGAKVDLYRFDFQAGVFIKRGTATVSTDKMRVVSDGRIVDQSSYWFVAVPSGVTTVVGRVIDSFGFSVVGAKASVNGRAATTDQNGGFNIRDVATAGLPSLQVEVVVPQQYGIPPRGTSAVMPVVVGGVTNVGIIALSGTNQAALVLSPFSIDFDTAATTASINVTLTQPAPAGGLVVNLASDDTSVATVPGNVTIPAGQTTVSFNVTRVGPGVAFIEALATLGGNTLDSFAVVSVARPAPVLTSVSPASAPVGASIVISGTGFSTKPDNNYFAFVRNDQLLALSDPSENQIVLDTSGKPALQIEVPPVSDGAITILAAVVDDVSGIFSNDSAPLNFTVLPSNLNAPTLTSVSPSQGKPRDQITLTGTGFGPEPVENEVIFRQNGIEIDAFVIQSSASQLLIEVPSFQIQQGPATIFARRIGPDGSSSSPSNALSFTITAAASMPATPTLTSVVNVQTQMASGRDGEIVIARGTGFGTNFIDEEGFPGNGDPLITGLLFYQNGEFVTFAVPISASNGTQLTAIIPPGLAAGTVQITAVTVDFDSGFFSNESAPVNFTITASSLPRFDEDEPNDTPELATFVELPSIVDGDASFEDLGDLRITFEDGSSERIMDLFFLTLDKTTNLSLDLQFTQGADFDLFLLKAEPDNNGVFEIISLSAEITGTKETILESLPAGDYLIGIGVFEGNSTYSLTITEGASVQNTLQKAQPAKGRRPIAVERRRRF
jgi:uncharacterized protein (TIGR03437 family)